MDLSVAFAIALSKLEPEVVYGRTFINICQQPPLQRPAHSGSFLRFPKPEQRHLKTRQKIRILANLLIGLLPRLLRHHDARKLQTVINKHKSLPNQDVQILDNQNESFVRIKQQHNHGNNNNNSLRDRRNSTAPGGLVGSPKWRMVRTNLTRSRFFSVLCG